MYTPRYQIPSVIDTNIDFEHCMKKHLHTSLTRNFPGSVSFSLQCLHRCPRMLGDQLGPIGAAAFCAVGVTLSIHAPPFLPWSAGLTTFGRLTTGIDIITSLLPSQRIFLNGAGGLKIQTRAVVAPFKDEGNRKILRI